ncbi:MAG: 23S rRNA (pseudouridine(1915)-N(3))-methyltransferase RlmH [Desulfovibrio sp.]|nr:23S rRNA (pseudouridine(1915)-N(3))-methyltransferase RlmH [Desulfovibrio sp.]
MASKLLRCLCVGKLKSPFWKEAASHYAGRLSHWRRLDMTDVRDGDAALPPAQRIHLEGQRILEALTPQDVPLVLDEHGQRFTSLQLAELLRQTDAEERGRPCFIVGGAWGLDASVRHRAKLSISLSDMTLPHELARVFLMEQLYRAECILHRTPYHH